ncbi:hypothetical protein BJX62DRAFT_217301 [Aspergillus germanicus]
MTKQKCQTEPRRPKALIVPPRKEHTHTIILLHEKGDKGREFGRGFLKATGLQDHFPNVRFVFPCAFNAPLPTLASGDKTQVGAQKRITAPAQWFDDRPHVRSCTSATASLPETGRFMQRLVHEEAKVIAQTGRCGMHGAHRRIIIGGKGQGGAAALLYLLGSHRQLGGLLCFDTVLSWEYQLQLALEVTGSGGGDSHVGALRGVNLMRGLLGFEGLDESRDLSGSKDGLHHLRTPVFFGCGGESRCSGRPIVSLLGCGFQMDVTERWCENRGEQRYAHPDNVEAVLGFLAGMYMTRVCTVTNSEVVVEKDE